MGIPVEVPGLDTIIPELGNARLVVVESGADGAKSFFVRRLALTALRREQPVTFVISRDRGELQQLLTTEGKLDTWAEPKIEIFERDSLDTVGEYGTNGGLLAFDSFSFLTLDLPGPSFAALIRRFRELCHEKGTTIVLATDRGMFEAQSEAVAMHLADGVIQFHSKEGPEGIVRYLRIPKWMDGKFVDRNIYYEFDGKRLAIDLRRRVL
jgi:KaiC/GvpD/RAD55 family RecA-like ATPase